MSKQRVIEIALPLQFRAGEVVFVNSGDETVYISKFLGKKLKDKDRILGIERGLLGAIFFDAKTGTARTHIHLSIKELEKFTKSVKARAAYFKKQDKKRKKEGARPIGDSFWMHLNPELSFFFTGNK